MKPIESFTLDHTNLIPGIYERYTKHGVKTWDIRFKKPNCGNYILPETSHTLEHFLATYLKNCLNSVVGVFPMGCLTGFYILTTPGVTLDELSTALLGAHSYILQADSIPGATFESCGNYMFQDLKGAKYMMTNFYNEVLVNYEMKLCEDLVNVDKKLVCFDEEDCYCGDCLNSIGDR